MWLVYVGKFRHLPISSWSRGVTVSTLDSESSDRGSNPRGTLLQKQRSSYAEDTRLLKYTWPGSNWRPSACEADVIATRPQVPLSEKT